MAEASLKLGGSWGVKEGSLLGFNDENGNYKPIPFDFTRATTATRVNRNGLIEEVQSGVPRIDFSNGDGSLLLEPQRTNLITYSEDFTQAAWTKTGSGLGTAPVLTNNYGISPDGTQNASRLQMNLNGGTAGSDISYLSFFISSISSAANSVYLKSLDGNVTMTFRCGSTFKSIIVTNEWQRFNVVDASGTDRFQVLLYGNSDSQSADLLIYGAQLEAGSYPTSLIKTSGSAVTRNNETISANTSSFGITDEFTLFIDTNGMQVEGTSLNSMDDLRWYSQTSDYYRFYKTSDALFISNLIRVNDRTKIALKVTPTECKTFVDGVLNSTISLTTPFTSFDSISKNSETKFKDNFKKIILFPTALTDEEAIALTTL